MHKYVKKLINIIYGTKFREGIYTYDIRETSKVNGFNPFRCQDKERIEGGEAIVFLVKSVDKNQGSKALSKTIKYVNIIVSIHNLIITAQWVLPQISVFAFKHCHVYSIIIVILYRRLLDDGIRQ